MYRFALICVFLAVTMTLATLAGAGGFNPVHDFDGCGLTDDYRHIDVVTGTWDLTGDDDSLVVEVELCGDLPSDGRKSVKYQVHIDHTAPFFDDNDGCDDATDDRMRVRGDGKTKGPGVIILGSQNGSDDVDNDTIRFRVNVDDLNPDLNAGDTLALWVDVSDRGVRDRATNVSASADDDCLHARSADEVLLVSLVSTVPCACDFSSVPMTVQEWGANPVCGTSGDQIRLAAQLAPAALETQFPTATLGGCLVISSTGPPLIGDFLTPESRASCVTDLRNYAEALAEVSEIDMIDNSCGVD